MGIIDSLASGFGIVSRRLWLILIPVLLDVYLWLGPRVSIEPLFKRLEPLLNPQAALALSKSDAQLMDASREAFMQMGKSFNLLSMLVNSLLGVPSLVVISPSDINTSQIPTIQISSGWVAFGLTLLLSVVSVLIAVAYLTLIARVVSDVGLNLGQIARQIVVVWGRVLLLALILLLLSVVFVLPVSVLSALLAFISQSLAFLAIGLFSLVAFWVIILVMIYLVFCVDSMLINDAGIRVAMRNSVVIVRRNFWPTIGLIVLVNVIGAGLSLVWQRLTFAPWAVVVGILGNAYVGSGLVASVLVFYRDRYLKWQKDLVDIAAK